MLDVIQVSLGMRLRFALVLLLLSAACRKYTVVEKPTLDPMEVAFPFQAPKSNGIFVKVSSIWGGQSFAMDTVRYVNSSGNDIRVTNLKYILSDFQLQTSAGTWIRLPESYGLINYHIGVDSFWLKNIPNGSYNAVKFRVGLDSLVNMRDPKSWKPYTPTDPAYCEMYWGWAGGFIFYGIEGFYKNTAGNDEGFSYHIGGNGNDAEVTLPLNVPITVQTNNQSLNLESDVKKFFDGSSVINLRNEQLHTHSSTDTTLIPRLKANLSGIFSVR